MLPLSAVLQAQAQKVMQHFREVYGAGYLFSLQEQWVLASSNFVSDMLLSQPTWLERLRQQPPTPDEWQHYTAWLQKDLEKVRDEAELMHVLRLFRCEMMVRIAWAQALRQCTTEETLQQLSGLAKTLIVSARDWLYCSCCDEWGTPCNDQGKPQPLLILGMGKLGGGELNFSSDIDLIFAYPENGHTLGGRHERDNAQFFTRLSQRLIKALDQQTIDGFVYRVDMRLRPFGDSGPLVMSFAALEDYYQEQACDWERYAMVKARLIGGSEDRYSRELRETLRPFVFRRYIDFSVIQSLRNMKGMIARKVRRRGLKDNINLVAGGIREIEFIAQVFQLIRGGCEPALQDRSLLPTLKTLSELGLLEAGQVQALSASYLFLRRLENLLQAIADQQTQTIPQDELDQARLTHGMGLKDWPALLAVLDRHMQAVRAVFSPLIGDDGADIEEDLHYQKCHSLWQDRLEENEVAPLTPHLGEQMRKQILHIITHFRHDVDKRTIGPRGRNVLDQLMPRLLAELCPLQDAPTTLLRLTQLLLSIITRTTYLELLAEYPAARNHMIRLCAASPMVANRLSRYPMLLDELLEPATLYQPIAPNAYHSELRQYLLRVAEEDDEQKLEALRQFKQAQLLRIAAADIAGALQVMKVSDHLTYLATAIIDAVVQQAWGDMVARFGQPSHLQDRAGSGFAVIGYGKLGGWELGYSSDLDLVFLVECPPDVTTDGERSIDGLQFYLRLAQRVMHLFSTRTSSGILYEVDARLRPSGAAAMLVSTLGAFANYQQHEAWTWEHQALVRTRIVHGDPLLHRQFDALRREILCKMRDRGFLRREVREMREKMRRHQGNQKRDLFDIKADEGGIIDIEFIAQYLVLGYASTEQRLTRWPDNVRIFALMANEGIMPEEEARALTTAYTTMRDTIHHLALQEHSSKVSSELFAAERQQVRISWLKWLG